MLKTKVSKNYLNSQLKAQVLPGFTSLRSQKFHPYLVGLNIDHMIRDFSHTLFGAYSLWKNLANTIYPKRAFISLTLIALALLGIGSSQEYKRVVTSNGFILANSQNVFQMTASIVADNVPLFHWPFSGNTPITTPYSRWHPGIDMPQPHGTTIKPIASGTVTEVETSWFGYGKSVIVSHGSGYASRYAHLSKIAVKVGDKVGEDTTIGEVGSTGHSTGNHLHLEIYDSGRTLNPVNVLPAQTSLVAANK